MNRVSYFAVLILLVVLVTKCGDDGGTGAQGDEAGFMVTYRWKEQIGINGCRANQPVRLCDIWCDWWSQHAVDSVRFFYPFYFSNWAFPACWYHENLYASKLGNEEGMHWTATVANFGAYDFDTVTVSFSCLGFLPDSAVHAWVYYSNGSFRHFQVLAQPPEVL